MGLQPARMPVFQGNEGDSADADLLDRVREGDAAAFQAILDRYWGSLVGFAFRLMDSADAAEDVVQQAFIRFWERRERWRAGSAPRPILYTLVRNLALNQLESDRARIRRRADGRVLKQASVATPAQLLDEQELIRLLDDRLQRLSPRRREALLLARFHHMTHAEIANVMGLSQRTVTNHISTALAELEAALKPYLKE